MTLQSQNCFCVANYIMMIILLILAKTEYSYFSAKTLTCQGKGLNCRENNKKQCIVSIFLCMYVGESEFALSPESVEKHQVLDWRTPGGHHSQA